MEENEALLWLLTGLSVFMFIATLFAMPLLLARIPADYFVRRPVRNWHVRHPAIHLLLVVIKNLLGLIVLLAGLTMLVLPGQGLLTIFLAIILLDIPGKRWFERWMIRRRPIFRAANWIRAKYHRPPLELPKASESADGDAEFE